MSDESNKCKKTSYGSTIEAHLALEAIRTRGKIKEKTPTRYYRCQDCKKYHLTSSKNRGAKYNPDKRERQRTKKR